MTAWRPPEELLLSEWADRHYSLSAETSSTPGRWSTLPYQRGIMDTILRPEVERVSVMKSSRVGYTQACIQIPLAYCMAHEPRSAVVVQPTEKDAEEFSKESVAPMFRDIPVLHGLLRDRAKDSTSTLLKKVLPGMTLSLGGANSSRVFRRLTCSIGFADEVDAYPPSAGGEGDPLALLQKRMADAWDATLVEGSSPKLAGSSRIARSYETSDQRRYWIPCPHCDEGQPLEWGGREADYGFKWTARDPETVAYLCRHCHALFSQRDLWVEGGPMERGLWTPGNEEEGSWPGFHVWAAYSILPDAAWPRIVRQFLEALGDPLLMQVWTNTVLGQPFEEVGDTIREEPLLDRREVYPLREGGSGERMVPSGAVFLTCSVDVQLDRLEVGVTGWGLAEESWHLSHHVLAGDPTATAVWEELWLYMRRPWYLERAGGELVDYIRSTTVDSGYCAKQVYDFTLPRQLYLCPDQRYGRTWATKGRAGQGTLWPKAAGKAGKDTGSVCPVWTTLVDAGKDALFARLPKVQAGPGAIHFPLGPDFGPDYFRQLTAEHAMTRRQGGQWRRAYELRKGRTRNEALDIAVGNYAALAAYQALPGFSLEDEAERANQGGGAPPPEAGTMGGSDGPHTPAAPPDPGGQRQRQRGPRRSSYLGG